MSQPPPRDTPAAPSPSTTNTPPQSGGSGGSETAAALRLILATLTEDPALRELRLVRDLFALHETGGLSTIFGVVGYLLVHVADGLQRGNGGSKDKAIDAVLDELNAVLDAQREPDGER